MNPLGRAFPVENRTWIQSPSRSLLTPASGPLGTVANKYDWPVPERRQNPRENISYTENILYLRGADQFFGLAGKPNFDWPVPRGPQRATTLLTWTQSLNQTTLTPPVLGPLGIINFQTDWPVPKGPVFALENRTFLENLTYIIGKDFFPNRQSDWPVPNGKQYPVSLRFFSESTLRFRGLDSLRISQYDWPVPRGPRYPSSLREFQLNLLQGVLRPVAPYVVTISVTLTDINNNPAANLTGLKWAFWDQATPNLDVAPTGTGTGATTDANGLFSVTTIPGSALAQGATGWITITNSDGTVGQSPIGKVAAGPVVAL